MSTFNGTVEEFEAARADFSDEELNGYLDDERTGISQGAKIELRHRRKAAAASVTFAAHMAQDGSVVVDELEFDNPDFLERTAAALTDAAAEAHSRHASAIALSTA